MPPDRIHPKTVIEDGPYTKPGIIGWNTGIIEKLGVLDNEGSRIMDSSAAVVIASLLKQPPSWSVAGELSVTGSLDLHSVHSAV